MAGMNGAEATPVSETVRVVPRANLSEIIARRAISTDMDIVATLDETVRAIDVLGSVAAVFRFSLDPQGDSFA